MLRLDKHHCLVVDATSQYYQDKLDFILVSEWLGGDNERSYQWTFEDIDKEYESWTQDLNIDCVDPSNAKRYLLKILSKPKAHNTFWNDHIGSMVRSINEGYAIPKAKSPYVIQIREVLLANLPLLTEFTRRHISRLRRKNYR